MRLRIAALALAVTLASGVAKAAPSSKPCPEGLPAGAQCIDVAVPENRTAPGGRSIDLHIVRLPAKTQPTRNAIFIFQGGPGQAATTLSDFYAEVYEGARATHDIVLIDQRGTGRSNGLFCKSPGTPENPEGYLADLFDPDVMRACRAELEKRADLTQYTTSAAVEDAEAVRKAFGYGAVDIYGTSYGTRVALEYARRHPGSVRTLTLKGVFPPNATAPADFALHTDRAIRLMIQDCRAEAACDQAYPRLSSELSAVFSALDRGPEEAALTGGGKVQIQRELFGAALRSLLQSTSTRAMIPRLVHAAAQGNWMPFADIIVTIRKGAQTEIATGMMVGTLCAEDVPYIDITRARADSDSTALRTYWLDQTLTACALWPRGGVPTDWRQPFKVTVPAILISGNLDPATPPSEAVVALRYLSNAKSIVIGGGSHSFSGLKGCVDKIMTAFVIAERHGALDTSCVAAIKPPPFQLPGEATR